jgi:hypothetical protein
MALSPIGIVMRHHSGRLGDRRSIGTFLRLDAKGAHEGEDCSASAQRPTETARLVTSNNSRAHHGRVGVWGRDVRG